MKKGIGIFLMLVCGVSLISMFILLASNQVPENYGSIVGRQIFSAIGFGGLGYYLYSTARTKEKEEKEKNNLSTKSDDTNLPTNRGQ